MIVPNLSQKRKSSKRSFNLKKEKALNLKKMSEVELQEIEWLWKPYIPFGKMVIIQGDPGEGKTTFALRLAAACSSDVGLPGMSQDLRLSRRLESP